MRHGDVKGSLTLEVFRKVDEWRRSDLPAHNTRGTLRKRHETIDDLQRRNVVEDPRVFEVVPTEVAMTTPRSEQLEPGERFAK